MVKPKDRRNKGGGERGILGFHKMGGTVIHEVILFQFHWTEWGVLSLLSYFLKEQRLQVKSMNYACLHYVSSICETVQSHPLTQGCQHPQFRSLRELENIEKGALKYSFLFPKQLEVIMTNHDLTGSEISWLLCHPCGLTKIPLLSRIYFLSTYFLPFYPSKCLPFEFN